MSPDPDRARVFDAVAEAYDRTRPSYPGALIDEVLGPSPAGVAVLDIACGTGIASRQLAARGADVLGVDLNAGMAAIAARHGIRTEVAGFEEWDPAGRAFDVVTCAQAWHWLDPEVSAKKAAAVLRPGGRLCVFWNIGHQPDDLADALTAVYERMLGKDSPLFIGYATRRGRDATAAFLAAHGVPPAGFLGEAQAKTFPWSLPYTAEAWVDELRTHSDHVMLGEDVLSSLLEEVAATIDSFGGGFDMEYESLLVSASRS